MTSGELGKEGGKEGRQDLGGVKQEDRGKTFTFPELMCSMWSALGTNERFSADQASGVPLSTFNSTYKQRVKWMKEHDE